MNDLLDLAKLEAGKMEFQMQVDNVYQIAKEAVTDFIISASEEEIAIELLEPTVSTEIICDHYKVGQVIRNLLSNAMKYTPQGKKISVSFSSKQTQTETSTISAVQVQIIDQGTGVPKDELKTIFHKYIQSSQAKIGGTGLGLAICQQIVKGHNGEIWAENTTDGAMFCFTLPYS